MNELAITGEKLDLIKRTVAKGASTDELELFLYTCKRTGLDPLTRQIYCIKRGGQMTIQTGIDGYRAIADRTGKYGGNDDPVFDSEEKPRRASVTVYKLVEGVRCPFTSTARWDQYYPGKSPLWDKMPHLMLGKCAEALALRKAFPQDLSGLYTKEEMEQADRELPKSPSGFVEVRKYALKEDDSLPQDKFIENKFPASQENDRGIPPSSELGARVSDPAASEPTYWTGVIKAVTHVPKKPNWKSRLHWIEMENGESAGTWEEALAADAEIVAGQGEVRVKVQRSKRDSSKWEYLGFEPIKEPTQPKSEELPW